MEPYYLKGIDVSTNLEKVKFKYTLKIENGLETIFEKESDPVEMIGDCLLDAHNTITELIHKTSEESQEQIIKMSGKEPKTEEERLQIIKNALKTLGIEIDDL